LCWIAPSIPTQPEGGNNMETSQKTVKTEIHYEITKPEWLSTPGDITYHLMADGSMGWEQDIDLTRDEYVALKEELADMRGIAVAEREPPPVAPHPNTSQLLEQHGVESIRYVGFAPDLTPDHTYTDEDLLYLDEDGDNIDTRQEKVMLGGDIGTVTVLADPEASSTDVVRLLRKIGDAIEKEGLASGPGACLTEHPVTEHIERVRAKIESRSAE
jgi:hypothetical protein